MILQWYYQLICMENLSFKIKSGNGTISIVTKAIKKKRKKNICHKYTKCKVKSAGAKRRAICCIKFLQIRYMTMPLLKSIQSGCCCEGTFP